MANASKVNVIQQMLATLQESLDHRLAALSRDPTPAAVHDTRTSIRRLRAALRAMKRQLHPLLRRRYLAALQDLTLDLEAVREADVREVLVKDLLERHSVIDHEHTDALIATLVEQHVQSRRDLRILMNAAPWQQRQAEIEACSRRVCRVANTDPAARLIGDAIARRHRRLRRALRHIGHKPRKLHRLRLRIKETRYLEEVFGPLLSMSQERELQRLRQLQDRLGEFHDNWCLRKWLRSQSGCHEIVNTLCDVVQTRQAELLKLIARIGKRLREELPEWTPAFE
jgi:CHAD domain-containing protein